MTVIGTGFDHARAPASDVRAPRPRPPGRGRGATGERAPLEIRDEDIDVPPFLR